jgi:6-phospho-3-hexuloisomerase
MESQRSVYDAIASAFFSQAIDVIRHADYGDFSACARLVDSARRIFLTGAGRSGLVARFFAMRLMHLGKEVFVVGDTTTPSIHRDDLLIAISGSGKTESGLTFARKAKGYGAKVLSVTIRTAMPSPLEALADYGVRLAVEARLQPPAGSRATMPPAGEHSTAPMGTLFEVSALIYLEMLIAEIIRMDHISERDMRERHANLE